MAGTNKKYNLSQFRYRPNPAIFQLIDRGAFRFGGSFLQPYCRQLALEEYERCETLLINKMNSLSVLEEDINIQENLMKRFSLVRQGIEKLEEPIKEDLIQAAIDIITDLYDVPEHIMFDADIVETVNLDTVNRTKIEHDKLPPDFDAEVKKRLLLNFIPHGSTMHVWKSAHHLIKNHISENLFMLYEEYVAIVSWLIWQIHPITYSKIIDFGGDKLFTQGQCQCRFKEPNSPFASIFIEGVNFPTLLHELNKGVMDYLISIGIPSEYSPSALEMLYADADDFSLEPWYYYLSPSIWTRILDKEQVAPRDIPAIVNKISLQNLQGIQNYFISLFHESNETK